MESDKRDWLMFNQTPQYPVLNINDACYFPIMSKLVSQKQKLLQGGKILKGDQL